MSLKRASWRLCVLLASVMLLTVACDDDSSNKCKLTITLSPEDGGIVNPTGGEYEMGETVEIKVSPNEFYEFTGWSGDWNATENPLTITIDGDKNLQVNFKDINPVYLAENEVTVKANDYGEVGDSGKIDGVYYKIVSEEQLRTMIVNGEDLSNVCTSKVTNMSRMFFESNLINGDISGWDVSNVTDMSYMLAYSTFNGDLSTWDVSNVTYARCFGSGTSEWTLPKPAFTVSTDCSY